MLEFIKSWTFYLAAGIEAGAALVVGIAAFLAIGRSFVIFLQRHPHPGEMEQIRLQLGPWLALALEFELAADILRTAIAPSWNDIGQLGAIIVLRTALNYFLQQDIDRAAARSRAPQPGAG